MGMAMASYHYRTTRSHTDEPLRTRLVELARAKPRFGYRRLHVLSGRGGEQVNHKRVHRVYRGQQRTQDIAEAWMRKVGKADSVKHEPRTAFRLRRGSW
jgi:creatinine amidohydrolase/Fe(II)-dependent formamide hydrolase-like protein